jgi:hypothetical protein
MPFNLIKAIRNTHRSSTNMMLHFIGAPLYIIGILLIIAFLFGMNTKSYVGHYFVDYRSCTIPDGTQGREKYKSNYASCSGQISSVKTIRHKSSAHINSARPKNHESTCLLLRCVTSYWSICAEKQEYIKSSLF